MHRAFTLIELLIVIAILAVLAAILFPVFSRAQKRARMAQCLSNLRQIGAAIGSYAVDWDDRYPWAARSDSVIFDNIHPSLPEALDPYIRTKGIWACPSDTGETYPNGPLGYRGRTRPFYTMKAQTSYDYFGVGFAPKRNIAGRPVSAVKSPSSTTISFENRPWHGSPRPDDCYLTDPELENVLFCDGHVDRRTDKQIQDAAPYFNWILRVSY